MENNFKVVIVGGSVAGLSLAHCLERLGISFVILEQGEKIAPYYGASLGIMPNGARILDQLGFFDNIESEVEPLEFARIRHSDGFWFQSRYPGAMRDNFGYPISFLERGQFLQILHRNLENKNQIHTAKKVIAIENHPSKAVVKTSDGSEYAADLVVGADGVHSIVRSEILKSLKDVGQVSASEDEYSGIKYEYSCVYGISLDVPHIEPGVQLSLMDNGFSIHTFTGKQSKLFWFIMVKTSDDHRGRKEKYSTDTARQICDSLRLKKLNQNLTFGDIWSRCTIFQLTPLEEGVFKRWNYGRCVCIGDAVRKMAPNIGQGANLALEDSAKLSSLLHQRLSHGALSASALSSMLDEFAEAQKPRTNFICSQSELLVRMHANEALGSRLLGRYLIPCLKDAAAGLSGTSICGSAKLDFLDLPARSLKGAWEGSFRSVLTTLSYLQPRPGPLSYALSSIFGFSFFLFLRKYIM